MRWLRGVRLIAGVGLGMGLFFFVPLGSGGTGGSPFLGTVSSWLCVLAWAAVVISVALITTAVLTPQRPGPVAAAVGALGGFLLLVLPNVWISLFWLLDRSVEHPLRELWTLFACCWEDSLPLAVACWLGASYWQSDSWSRFWQGAGGAVVKGGLVAGLVCLPVIVALRLYDAALVTAFLKARVPPLEWFVWAVVVAQSLGGVTRGAVVTALFLSWRPRRWLGGVAGAVLLVAIAFPTLRIEVTDNFGFFIENRSLLVSTVLLRLLPAAVIGGIAGSYAGRWLLLRDGTPTSAPAVGA